MESYVRGGKIENSTIALLVVSLLVVAFGIFLCLFRLMPLTPILLTSLFCVTLLVLWLLWLFIADKLLSGDYNSTSAKGQLLTLDDLEPGLGYQILWVSRDKFICQIELVDKAINATEERGRYCEGQEIYELTHSHNLDFKAGLVFSKKQAENDTTVVFCYPHGNAFVIVPKTPSDEGQKE